MRNQFDYYGLKSPTRRALFKEVLNKIGKPSYEEHFEIAKELYAQPQREFHYCAIELSRFNKKKWDKRLFTHHEFLATHNSWWDTVDATHSIIGSPYFQKFPAERKKLDLWNTSDNMWLIRLSIIFQLHYKDKMDTDCSRNISCLISRAKSFLFKKPLVGPCEIVLEYTPIGCWIL